MCGIGGIWRADGRSASHQDLRRLMSAMRHRGPEGAAFARLDRGSLLLGFLRLSFTDQTTGQQPLFNEDHSLALVYNGEIYEYQALKDDLLERGHTFRTRSDSEVILHLYEEYGERFTDYLNGEFAFGLWDSRREELLCVRDRFGVKPLYYAQHQGAFVFASEAKGLLALSGFPRALDPLWFTGPGLGLAGSFMAPFSGVSQVRPGHLMRVSRQGRAEAPYWRPRFEKRQDLSFPEAAKAVRATLTRAVERRIAGEVPVALSLSSGMDSTIVAGLSAALRPSLRAFTVSFPGASYDESARAEKNAAHFGLSFTPVRCTPGSLAEGFLRSIWSTEIATNTLSTAARIALTAAVRRAGYKALLGGEAADEIFGGYPYFGLEALWRRCQSSGEAACRAALDRFRRDEALSRGVFWDDAWRGRPSWFGYPSLYQLRVMRMTRAMRLLLSRDARRRIGATTPLDTMRRELDLSYLATLAPFDATRIVSRSVFGTFAVAALGDRVEMASSLEGRVPYLDRELVSLAYSLPESFCIAPGNFTRKHVLRQAFASFLPPSFAAPPKYTYMAPTFAELARTEVGRGLFTTLLSDRAVRAAGLLHRGTVRLALAAWRHWPRSSPRFVGLDGFVGYLLSVQALHHVFIEQPGRFGHRGPLLDLEEDRSPRQV